MKDDYMNYKISMYKSLLDISFEKIFIMDNILVNIIETSNFYTPSDPNMFISKYKTPLYIFEEAKTNYTNLIEIKSKLHNLYKLIEEPYEFSELKLLFLYNQVEDNIELFLTNNLKSLIMKTNQYTDEVFMDYVTRPNMALLYSTKAFNDHIETSYDIFIKQFYLDTQLELRTLYFWDFKNSDNFIKPYSDDNNYTNFLQMSYWYHHIPFFIVNMTHESVHALFNENELDDFKLNDYKSSLSHALKECNETIFQSIFDINDPEGLVEEIISDLVSLIIHKESYILSLFHVLSRSLGLFRTFRPKGDLFQIKQLSWDYKRDFSIIRLKILIDVYTDYFSKEGNLNLISYIESISQILDNIYPSFDSDRNSSELYLLFKENYPNYFEFYDSRITVVTRMFDIIRTLISEIDIEYYNEDKIIINNHDEEDSFEKLINFIETTNRNGSISNPLIKKIEQINFNILWEKRFRNNENNLIKPITNDFRIELLSISENNEFILKNIDNKYNLVFGDAYFIEYIKTRNDGLETSNIKNINKFYISELTKLYLDNTSVFNYDKKYSRILNTFGSYDYISIMKQTKKIDIISYLNEGNEELNYNIKFYRKKHLLIKAHFEGKIEQSNDNYKFNMIIQVLLDDNGLKNIYNSFSNYYEQLKNITDCSIDFFKSLGPKDIVICINSNDLKSLYRAYRRIENVDKARTYTSLAYENFDEFKENLNKSKFEVYSILRLRKNSREKIKEILSRYKNDGLISSAYRTQEVTDLEVNWNIKNMTSENLNAFTKELSDNFLVSDIHTKFRKRFI